MKNANERTCGRCGEQGHHHHDCYRIHEERRIKSGVELITAERKRQIEFEGWTPDHDDSHENGEMACAAACYAISAAGGIDRSGLWPWSHQWWKPTMPIRDLVKAGALIAAEIDRRQRQAASLPSAERSNPSQKPT